MGGILKPYQPNRRYIPKKKSHEESIQRQVCSYLRLQYPQVIFRTDFTAGRIPLTPYQGRQYAALQSGRGFPDIFIYTARRGYCGLALELKRDGTVIYATRGPRKGKLTSEIHIQEQAAVLQRLNNEGYFARFAVGFDKAVKIIDWYFNKQTPQNAELF